MPPKQRGSRGPPRTRAPAAAPTPAPPAPPPGRPKRPATALAERPRVARGRGEYVVEPQAERSFGSLAGEAIGSLFGARNVGRRVGAFAHGVARRIFTGRGRYEEKQRVVDNISQRARSADGTAHDPTIVLGTMTAEMSRDPRDREIMRYRKSDRVGSVLATAVFTTQDFSINPGNVQLFKYLALVARGYTKYEMLGMIVEYRSLASDSPGSLAEGEIVMGTQYDSARGLWTNANDLAGSPMGKTCKPSEGALLGIECAPNEVGETVRYVRIGGNVAGGVANVNGARLSDVGVFQVGVIGTPAAAEGSVIGEIWIHYDVALSLPTTSLSYTVLNCGLSWSTLFTAGNATWATFPGSVPYGNPIVASNASVAYSDGSNFAMVSSGGSTGINLPKAPGCYLVTLTATCSSGVFSTAPPGLVVTSGDCTLLPRVVPGAPLPTIYAGATYTTTVCVRMNARNSSPGAGPGSSLADLTINSSWTTTANTLVTFGLVVVPVFIGDAYPQTAGVLPLQADRNDVDALRAEIAALRRLVAPVADDPVVERTIVSFDSRGVELDQAPDPAPRRRPVTSRVRVDATDDDEPAEDLATLDRRRLLSSPNGAPDTSRRSASTK